MTNGGRPAARDLADAAATKNTLNYALGNLGGRQKAWMCAGQATSPTQNLNPPAITRKPGRPAKAPPPEELQQATRPHPAWETRRDHHAPSNSTSPQLANVLSHPAAGRPLPSPTAVFPSPSPSEEVEHASTPSVLDVFPLPSADGAQDTTSVRDEVALTRNTSPDIRFMEGVRQAAAAHKRPAERAPAHTDKRSRVEHLVQDTRTNPPSLSTNNLRRASLQSLGQGQRSSPVTTTNPYSPSLGTPQPQGPSPYHSPYLHKTAPQGMYNQHQIQVSSDRTTPHGQTPFAPAPSPSSAQESIFVPSDDHAPSPVLQSPNQVRKDVPSNWYTQRDCLVELERFTSTVAISDQYPRDGKRLNVLKDAVERQDWAYLTMHQYYCLLTADPGALPATLMNNPNLPNAVRLMRDCLDRNEILSPAVLQFFAKFPVPLSSLGHHFPRQFEQEATSFLSFMQMSANFDAVRTMCEQRNYPPLMRELFYDLGISSTVFQRIVFTAILRRIWSLWRISNTQVQSQFERQAIILFFASQAYFFNCEANRPDNQHQFEEFDQREREVERQQWGSQLKQLCDGYQRALQQNGSLLANQLPPVIAPHPRQQTHRPPPQNLHIQQSSMARPQVQATPAIPPLSAQATNQRGRGRGRPRLYPTPPRPQPAPSNQQVAQRPTPPSRTSLLPGPGIVLPQQRQANPARFGLHQAHLRSPLLRAKSADQKLYQYVKSFLKAPVRVSDAGYKIEKWTFNLTRDEFERIPKNVPNTAGAPPIRTIDERSRLLRLRCVKWTAEAPDEHTWATADTSWIRYSYFKFNGQTLQQRKKLHHGKDLPMDMSPFVKEGENTVEIAVMRQRKDENYREYLVAIEVLGFKSHASITKDCQESNHISAPTVLERIRQKLFPSDDDDEIAVVESNLTINLFDPFSASKICDIPVRGRACLHYDCFDLDTFLQTREKKGDATAADQWKCPICNCDARPQHLVVDGFLENVRSKLYGQGLQNTRAIIVAQDGSWKPKAEVRDPNGVQDRDTPDDDPVPSRPQRQSSMHAEIIDLSD